MVTPSMSPKSTQFNKGPVTYQCILRPTLEPTSDDNVTIGGRNYQMIGSEASIASLRRRMANITSSDLKSIESFRAFLVDREIPSLERTSSTFLKAIKVPKEESPILHREILETLAPPLYPPLTELRPQMLETQMNRYHVPGIGIAIISDGKIESEGFGNLADKEIKIQAASISKSITALTILSLVQEGVFRNGLDTDVRQLLGAQLWAAIDPDNKTDNGRYPVTIRGLLSHTAGIRLGEGQSGFNGYPRPKVIKSAISDLEKIMSKLSALPASERTTGQVKKMRSIEARLADLRIIQSGLPTIDAILTGGPGVNSGKIKVAHRPDPEGRIHYTGGGTTILQKIIEEATGKPFAQVVQRQVFDKLEMNDSTFSSSEGPYSSGHDESGHPIPGGYHLYPEQAAAGLWSTPSDLAKVMVEVQKAHEGMSDLISRELAREMLIPEKGLGFAVPLIESAEGSRYFFHEGSNAGFRCILIGNLSGQGAVIMTNGDNGIPLLDEVLMTIVTSYKWKDAMQVDRLEFLKRQA